MDNNRNTTPFIELLARIMHYQSVVRSTFWILSHFKSCKSFMGAITFVILTLGCGTGQKLFYSFRIYQLSVSGAERESHYCIKIGRNGLELLIDSH